MKSLADGNQRFAHFVNGINARATTAGELRQAVDQRAIAARNLVQVSKPADMDAEKAAVSKAHEQVGIKLARLKELIAQATDASDASDAASSLVAEIDRIEKAYAPVALAILDLAL